MTHRYAGSGVNVSSSRIVVRDSNSGSFDLGGPLTERFVASMPERYRQEFGRVTARQHALIAEARGAQRIHLDVFTGSSAVEAGICVVAQDVPGLLALISAAILLEGYDISRADTYTRLTPKGIYEAVDLFWVRRPSANRAAAPGPDDCSRLRGTLSELMSSGEVFERLHQTLSGTSPGASETRVQFKQVRGSRFTTLELQSNDRPGLLAVVANALALEGVQILDSRIRTHGLRVHDYFDIVDADGSRPSGTRLQRIQLAVISAVDGPGFRPASGIAGPTPATSV